MIITLQPPLVAQVTLSWQQLSGTSAQKQHGRSLGVCVSPQHDECTHQATIVESGTSKLSEIRGRDRHRYTLAIAHHLLSIVGGPMAKRNARINEYCRSRIHVKSLDLQIEDVNY